MADGTILNINTRSMDGYFDVFSVFCKFPLLHTFVHKFMTILLCDIFCTQTCFVVNLSRYDGMTMNMNHVTRGRQMRNIRTFRLCLRFWDLVFSSVEEKLWEMDVFARALNRVVSEYL